MLTLCAFCVLCCQCSVFCLSVSTGQLCACSLTLKCMGKRVKAQVLCCKPSVPRSSLAQIQGENIGLSVQTQTQSRLFVVLLKRCACV